MTVQIAHDFTCPWCWIAWHQAQRLQTDFGVEIEWLAYELWPDELEVPVSIPTPPNPDRAPVPTRLELAYVASDVSKPMYSGLGPRIHNALEAAEHAKKVGVGAEMVERLYKARWLEGLAINNVDVLALVAKGIVPDVDAMIRDIDSRAGADKIVPFDKTSYSRGIYNVPTFWIGGKKYAEQPYVVLERALKASLK
jgi:predicted DsbA family dithiol-disulfide isomerase